MGRRRRHLEEQTDRDRWLVSYADFITLLFAFFVVMYSISSVNQDKYRVLSDAMASAFSSKAVFIAPPQVGDLVSLPLLDPDYVNDGADVAQPFPPLLMKYQEGGEGDLAVSSVVEEEDSFSERILNAAEEEINSISAGVEDNMSASIDEDLINIERNKFWLEIEIKSSLLFKSGSSELVPESVPLLVDLSSQFVDMPNRIHIEGFTDNKPINTAVFPSNWELSSARASAVVHLFERNGIAPSRLAAIGYGEYHPIVDNDTEESRAKNRRVVVVVLASLEGQENERFHEFELLKEKSTI